MLAASSVPHNITHACGHSRVVRIYSRSTREQALSVQQERNAICSDCCALVARWVSESNTATAQHLELPALTGSEKQIKWATSLRVQLLRPLLPAMTAAMESGGKFGAAVCQAIYALTQQRQSEFWIDSRSTGFNHHYLAKEASCFIKGDAYVGVVSEKSSFGRLRKISSLMIEDVKRRCPIEHSPAPASHL